MEKDWIEIKKTFRKEMKKRRAAITEGEALEAEQKNIAHLKASHFYKENQWIFPYISYQKELPTHGLIEALIKDGKRVAVPRVMGEEMAFFEIHGLADCAPGCMGILEPVDVSNEVKEKGLIIMPGLAFDGRGGRMGYGGGFYDKYLSRYPYHDTLAWMYDFQWVDEVPMEAHDHRIDALICPDKGLWSCSRAD